MAQISLREYLKLLLDGTKDYINSETVNLDMSIASEYLTAINTATEQLEQAINDLEQKFTAERPVRDGQHDEI